MLLTTTSNNIYVLDAYGGEKVSSLCWIILFSLREWILFPVQCPVDWLWFMSWVISLKPSLVQRCGFSLEPSPNTTIEATFTPDGQYVVSGIQMVTKFYSSSFSKFSFLLISYPLYPPKTKIIFECQMSVPSIWVLQSMLVSLKVKQLTLLTC